MPILERLLVALAERHHGGHVDLVECRQHRRSALRLDESLGDGRAALRHAHALLGAVSFRPAAIFGDGRHGLRLVGWAAGGGAAGGGGPSGPGRLLDVALHHTPTVAAAAHVREIDVVRRGSLPGGWRRARRSWRRRLPPRPSAPRRRQAQPSPMAWPRLSPTRRESLAHRRPSHRLRPGGRCGSARRHAAR